MMHVAYHNTTPIFGSALLEAARAAHQQDDAVMAIMRGGGAWTGRQLHAFLQQAGHDWELTSVRRSLSNLKKAGELVLTGTMVDGPKGRPENQYIRLVPLSERTT